MIMCGALICHSPRMKNPRWAATPAVTASPAMAGETRRDMMKADREGQRICLPLGNVEK